jgi:putative transposase
VVFNDALAARRDAYQAGLPYLTDAELSARLTAAKAASEPAPAMPPAPAALPPPP